MNCDLTVPEKLESISNNYIFLFDTDLNTAQSPTVEDIVGDSVTLRLGAINTIIDEL